MNIYADLYELAGALDIQWGEAGEIDWQQAQDLVAGVEAMDPQDRGGLQTILDYVATESDWDSGEVSAWPRLILDALDCCVDILPHQTP